jgi:four helix bundle protein
MSDEQRVASSKLSAMKDQVLNFEDLIAWQKARALTREIYHVTSTGAFAKDFGLREQIRCAAVSIMSNLAEGFERGGRIEFHRFLNIAKASCAELRSQLYVARDVEYIEQQIFSGLLTQAKEVARIIGGLRMAVLDRKSQKCSPVRLQL